MSYNFCDSQFVEIPVTSFDIDSNLVSCQITSGLGQIVNGNWVYTSYSTEEVYVTLECVDECGATCYTAFTINFEKNELPSIIDQQYADNFCESGMLRNIYVVASDNDDPTITYTLENGIGTIDPVTGVISYYPDTSGTYIFVVSVSDECGTSTATITDVIGINNVPTYSGYDSTIYLCDVEVLCFDISAKDPDGDPILFSQNSGLGQFTQLTDSTGRTCFTPNDVDSATYTFTYCVTDSCGDYPEKFVQASCDLEVNITVVINRAPQIVCPEELNFFTCDVDTFCFDIDANDPEFADLTFNILSQNATINGKSVCVVGSMADTFDVVIEVVDDCGHADTCSVSVNIGANRVPYVTSADDFDISFCDAEPICFTVFADDLDFNLETITTNYGTYDSQLDQICFTPDTSGIYTIITTATDSCGAVGFDTTIVNVHINDIPFIDAGNDFAVSLCQPGEVCFDVTIIDDNRAYTSIPNGFYNWTKEQYCFNADTSGVYEIIVSVTDSCDIMSTDTVLIDVTISEGPFVELGSDLDLFRCDSSEVCIDVNTISNYQDIQVTGGAEFNPETSQICFTPVIEGAYTFSVIVTDTCGLVAVDTVNVNIDFNNNPIISQMPDTTVYLCMPTSICLPFEITDENIASITTNLGSYENGQVCFVPYDSGTYEIIVTVVDDCGLTVSDTANVLVLTDQAIEISGQTDTTIFVCDLDTMCFPVYGIPDNATVSVSGVNVWYNETNSAVCFLAECALSNKITVTASTPCGDYSYAFTVDVICNTAPLVILPQDTSLIVCSPQDICLPIGITDVDNNLGDVSMTIGTYDAILNQFCFTADTAGTYLIGVTATDTCGAVDYDEIYVTVNFNTAPNITYYQIDTVFSSCDSSEICVPVTISDPENNLVSISTSIGNYNSETGMLCFVPDSSGEICIDVSATDECGLTTTETVCVSVHVGGYVTFECPTNIVADSVCGSDNICIPLSINGEIVSVVSSLGTYSNGQLCFFADTAGIYTISTTAYGDCNEASCTFTVEVNWKTPATISCPSDVDTLLCDYGTLTFDYTTSSSVDSVYVSPPAYIVGDQVMVPVTEAGTQQIDMIASGICGEDTCSFNVNARLNSAPTITALDTTLTVCTIDTVCLTFDAFDIDSNLAEVTSSLGVINGNTVCLLPIAYGQSSIVLTATDACGAQTSYTVNINLIQGGTAQIICPQDQFATLCGSDSVCVLVPITPFDADITVLDNGQTASSNFNAETGELCLYMDTEGLHNITIIADAFCSSDTCEFEINVAIAQLPVVGCPDPIDTTICLAQPDSFYFPVEVSGTGVEVTVNPAGNFTAGFVSIPVDTAGVYNVEVIASSNCGADTCITSVNITANALPLLTLPNDTSFMWCPGDTNTLCIDGIFASDEVAIISLEKVSGPGLFTLVGNDSGSVCFVPDAPGQYMFAFEATDGCHIITDTFFVDIFEKDDCDVCVRASISVTEPTPVGVQTDVYINVETNAIIGGFDILVSYDASVMTFNTATIVGTEIESWEYFTFRIGSDDCGANCPSGVVRLVGIADINNGPFHPPQASLEPNGSMVKINFLIANDQNLGDQFLPIDFVWYDCGDNTFSNTTGNILYLDSRIFNAEYLLLWDEDDDILFPEINRPFGMGANDQCMEGASSAPIRCIEFINGGIRVIHPDSIDDRGDINLNNIAYEIGDAVLYSNYFIYGLSVFTVNLAGQIAASDVNADGLTLSVADLVLMIRIIVGDADPIPKLNPYDEEILLTKNINQGLYSIKSEAISDIGAAYFVYDLIDDISIDNVSISDDINDMTLGYEIIDNQLRVLIYDIGDLSIPTGKNELLQIKTTGAGYLKLSDVEIVDYQGRPYNVFSKDVSLPDGFSLSQNYPNPFNPSTTIELSLPSNSDWTINIYNINGSLVREFNGSNEAGVIKVEWDGTNKSGTKVASGIYLYKVIASDFTETKKMILLK